MPVREVARSLSLGSRPVTLGYWLGCTGLAGSLFASRLPPLVDYPHHLALAEVARRLLFDPASPEHDLYVLNPFTYNGSFHLLTASLGQLVPIELAGKIVVAASLLLLAAGTVWLLRAARRPPAYAALFAPALFSFSVAWGFVNFALGLSLAVVTLALVLRATERASGARFAGTLVLGLATAHAHVLATLILCLLAFGAVLERTLRSGRSLRGAARGFLALAPLLGAGLFCIAVFRVQYEWGRHLYDTPASVPSPAAVARLRWFAYYVNGAYADGSDRAVLRACLGVGAALVGIAVARAVRGARGPAGGPAPLLFPAALALAGFLLVPHVAVGTHYVFQRLGQVAWLALLLALPDVPRHVASVVRPFLAVIPIVVGGNALAHARAYARTTDPLADLLAALPPGGSPSSVVFEGDRTAFGNDTLVHAHAHYAVRYGGDWAYNFARYLSLPVRYRAPYHPGWPSRVWENHPAEYDARCAYARRYELVVVKAPAARADDEAAVRGDVFGADADVPILLGRRGPYWAFDSGDVEPNGRL